MTDYLTEQDLESYCIRLGLSQFIKYGEPKDLTNLEKSRVYGSNIFIGLSDEQKHSLFLEIAEEMKHE